MSKKLFCDVCGKEMPNEGFQKDFYYARYCGSGYPSHHPDYDICTPCFQDMLQHVFKTCSSMLCKCESLNDYARQ